MIDEPRRLKLIDHLEVARAENASRFQNIVELAAQLFETPIAAITVLDENRQWFFASKGLSVEQGPRCDAFCDLAIQLPAPLVVEDARQDPRFVENPYVTQPPFLRFYAGAPIRLAPDLPLGALIVIDPSPRTPTEAQVEGLWRLAEAAADAFRMRIDTREQARLLAALDRQNVALREAQGLVDAAAELAKFGAWRVALGSGALEGSRELNAIFGFDDGDAPSLREILACYAPRERARVLRTARRALRRAQSFSVEERVVDARGREKWIRAIGRLARPEPGLGGDSPVLQGCALDVTEQRRSCAEIERLATRDPLTDLLNRRSLEDAYDRMRRTGGRLRMILVDIDHFKLINDGEGHEAGDLVIAEVSRLLQGSVRAGDCVGRLGGDEFLLMVRADAVPEVVISDRILRGVEASPSLSNRAQPVTVSIGEAVVSDPEMRFSAALRSADIALYESKKQGRGCAVRFTNAMGSAFERRRTVREMVDQALRENRLRPAYQVQRRLSDGSIAGFEALARIDCPEQGELTPGRFWEAIEDPQFANRISSAMFERVAADAGKLRLMGLDFGRIAVNLSELQLLDEGLPERLDDMFHRHGVWSGDFTLELTENILLSRRGDAVVSQIDRLAARGLRIALDDFGTGFASLTHLRNFTIHELKLDRSFVAELNSDPSAVEIIRAVIAMAKGLKIETVAEGVENLEIEALLRGFGCDIVQGFFYGRAAPFDQMVALLCAQAGDRRALAGSA